MGCRDGAPRRKVQIRTSTQPEHIMKLTVNSNVNDNRRAIKSIVESASRQLMKKVTRPNMSELQFENSADAELFDFVKKIKRDNSILRGRAKMTISEAGMMRRICDMQRLEGVTVSHSNDGNKLVVKYRRDKNGAN